jgi:Asp-tRNA(Asn)/Glu-tRNA(Gln) amidotransferase C subunit
MYTISDIKQIKKTAKQVLSQETLDIITKISKMIGVENQIPMFKIEKVHTIPQQITILLNKLSEDNYKDIESKLIKLIESNPSEIDNCSTIIFDIISNNAFYGSIYASLYVSLVQRWPNFKELFQARLNEHMIHLKNIKLVSSSDYDEFCKCNELNERYRTFSQFIVHLTLQGIIDNSTFDTFLKHLIQLLHT